MAHVKTVTTTLDSLPAGAGPEILANGKLKKVPLPQGVTRKMLLKDIILIAWPSLAVLLVTVLGWGLWGAWIALMLDQVLRTVLMVARYDTAKWVQIWGTRRK